MAFRKIASALVFLLFTCAILQAKDYYVKENGTGNGSSWSKAMSGVAFIDSLQDAKAGSVFHVAAGTYDLEELSGGNSYVYINNPTTIIGGYPAGAKTGATSSPSENTTLIKAGYFRLNTDGNVVFDGLRFETKYSDGAYDASSDGKEGLCVTLKNSTVVGTSQNSSAIRGVKNVKTILYNDSLIGNYNGEGEMESAILAGGTTIVKKCHITGWPYAGINASGDIEIDSTTITGNERYGIYEFSTAYNKIIVTNCTVTNNGTVGISTTHSSSIIKNNRIGIDANGNVKGNGIGIIVKNQSSSTIENNIVAGNDSIGIFINGVEGAFHIKGNYIGTDKDFNNLGNGSDGLFVGERCTDVTFPSVLDSANYIGFNKGNGINSQDTMTACNASFNFIGVTPQGDPMPNGKYGIYIVTSRHDHNLKGNLIGYNEKGGVYYSDTYTTITKNLFFGTKEKAISDHRASSPLSIPSISQVKKDNGFIIVEGTADAHMSSTIELFYTNGDPQTAHMFLGSTKTDKAGAFSFKLPVAAFSKYDNLCVSATATYLSQGTSTLSDPFCCEDCLCKQDTTPVNDTINVGEKFLDKVYTAVGLHDSIFENVQDEAGCDKVLMHRLMVMPDPSVKSYTVTNTNDEGEGSLRYAIEYATLSEVDTFRILFDFAQSGTHVIPIGSALSIWKRDNLIIDGSSTPDSIIIDAGNGTFVGLYVLCAKNLSVNSLTIRNAKAGISVQGSDKINITNCRVVENSTGIYIASTGVVVDNCLISGNTEYGIHRSSSTVSGCTLDNGGSTIKNCIIGLTDDQENIYPNNVGIYLAKNIEKDTIIGNIVSGNTTDGLAIANASNGGVTLLRNLIGVNDKYHDFGNGGSGINYTGRTHVNNGQIANANKSDANIIGCNHGYGINAAGPVKCGVNYIGVAPDGTIIGNKMGGINTTFSLQADGVVISGNGGDGIHMYYESLNLSARLNLKNSIIGGETPQKEGNKGYGIYVDSIDLTSVAETPSLILELENNTFGNNVKGGIYGEAEQILLKNSGNSSYITRNIFWGESQPFAIDLGDFNKPTIEDIIDKGDEYEIVGSIQFLDGSDLPQSSKVDSTKVGIELFWNKGAKETAYTYVGSTESDATGKWKYNLKKTDLGVSDISFISTAIHYINYTYGGGNYTRVERYTSALSESYDCEICTCTTDTTLANDTIIVGEKFLDKTYTIVGRHDSIFETVAGESGCDSVVMHMLIVKPNPDVKEYYVKTERWGKGDGSRWEDAMNGEDFAAYLPLAPDGVTFYIAEGTYKPVYGNGFYKTKFTSSLCYTINSNVTIKGGYPAKAETGAVSDPLQYETIFEGDILEDDVTVESSDDENFGISNEYGDDNVDELFKIICPKNFDVTFDGVKIKRSSNGVISYASSSKDASSMNFRYVTFENTYRGALTNYAYNVDINVDNSFFKGNTYCIYSSSTENENRKVNVSNTKFTHNLYSGCIVDVAAHDINIEKCNFSDNISKSNLVKAGNVNINHSHISNNQTDGLMICSNKNMFLNSDTIEGNVGDKIVMSFEESSIDSCEFIKNKGQLIYSSNVATITNTKVIENEQVNAEKNVDLIFLAKGGTLRRDIIQDNKILGHIILIPTSSGVAKEIIEECYIDGNTATTIFQINPSYFNLRNSTVSNNHVSSYIIQVHASSYEQQALVQNNTIVNNESDVSIFYGYYSDNKYINNTILGNKAKEKFFEYFHYYSGASTGEKSSQFVGNIVFGNTYNKIFSSNPSVKDGWLIKNNILPLIFLPKAENEADLLYSLNDNNIISDVYFDDLTSELTFEDGVPGATNHKEDISALFTGTYDPATGLFTPELATGEGFTPVAALKTDKLPDGTSIRFPLTETNVIIDQRGVDRLEQTCMGAYEILCTPDTTLANDTIIVGEKFLDKTYTVVGRHDSIFETISDESACDKVVMHMLVVKPNPDVKEYYVKTERWGRGDGSSWEDAMNGEDFATYLPLAPDGVTFHVAEGTYHPISEPDELLTYPWSGGYKGSRYYLLYAKDINVSILGGYPAKAVTGEIRYPQKYKAIFSGDLNEDDEWVEGWNNGDNVKWPANVGENSSGILYTKNATVKLSGISFTDANAAQAALMVNGSKIVMDNCTFTHNVASAHSGGTSCICMLNDCEVKIDSCRFNENVGSASYGLIELVDAKSGSYLELKNSYICDNLNSQVCTYGLIALNGENDNANIENCTFYNNVTLGRGGSLVYLSNGNSASVSNSTILKNVGGEATGGLFFLSEGCDLVLANNTILGNSTESKGSLFLNDGEGNNIKMYGNIICANPDDKSVLNGYAATLKESNNLLINFDCSQGGAFSSFEKDESDIIGEYETLPSFLDVELSNDGLQFRLKDNGGFTPTIALLEDKLPDGTSIRFPLTETTVTTDQRGVNRFEQTCRGAYELGCSVDTTVLETPDIITVGERFLGVVYSEAGRYDSIFENLQNVMGCDSVVMHTVVVENPFEGCEIGTVLFREDFGGNYISDPIAKSAGIPQCTYNYNENPKGAGNYAIRKVGWNHNQWFYPLYDHTFPDNGDRGYLMQVDGSGDNGVFYNTQIDDLCPNTHLTLSMWGMSSTSTGFGDDAKLKMILESLDGEVLATQDVLLVNNKGEWERFSVPYTVKEGQTSVVYKIINNSNTTSGNDFVLDDIEVRLCKPAVSVNSPIDSLCAGDDYVLTASYTNAGGYIEPLNFTWFKNEKPSYGLDGWTKVAEGQTLSFSDLKPEDNAYYRCVISSAGVPGEFNKCNSASDIVPILVKSCVVCVPDTTVLADPDVIQVGEQFLGVTYSEVGRHDSIFEVLTSKIGCDSVVMHSLVVKPNPAVKEYYVKTSRQGTGDGSSWENAMDGTDFANTLPLAPEGAAYYIAEGSYQPLCEDDYCAYHINSSVAFYGGYPADAVTGALSDPKKYFTVFNGDFKGDDKVVESLDERGCRLVDVENTDDNAYDMFYASVEKPLEVTFSGLSVVNATRGFVAFSGSVENEVNINVLDCRFENCRNTAIQSESLGTIKVSNSEFSNNSNCLYVSNAIDVALKNVTMTDNYGPYLVYMSNIHEDKTANLSMESVVAKNNTSHVQFWGNIDVTQSKFDNNSCVYSLILTPNADGLSPKINVDNSEFTNNTCEAHLIYASAADVTVSNSLFEGNAMGSSLIYPYNLTVDMSSILGNKCETGNIFEVVKNAEFTNDVINDNVSISMINYYTATDCKLLIDTCHVEANKGQLLTSGGTSNAFDARITRSDFIKNSLDEDKNWIMLTGNGTDVTVLMERDIMKENNFSNSMISSSSVEFTMNECHLQGNEASMLINFASSVAHIKNSAFEQNHVEKSVVNTNVCWDGIDIVNNTFASNKSDNSLFDCYYSSVVYNDNTIVGNDVAGVMFSRPYDKSFIGNIVWGNKYSELNYYGFSSVPQYNIMPLSVSRDYTETEKVKVFVPDETNIVADYYLDNYKNHPEEYEFDNENLLANVKNYSDIKDLFFGDYDASSSLFVPEVKNNGGFTPTVALKKDRLADKTSIRFLLSETIVEQDQRGVARLVSTCMGAYEYIPSDPIECVYESILFKEDFGGNNPTDALYSENGLKEGLCTLPCAGDCPLALNDYMQTGCYALLKEAYRRQPGYRSNHIYEGWYADFDDETYLGDIQRGYFMSIDMASKPTTFYQREINDLCENTNLSLSMSARPLYASDNTILYMSVEDMSGNPLTERTEVVIDKTVNEWKEYSVTFSVPQGASSVMFKIYSEGGHQGNDFALDDIIVRLCKAQVDVNRPTEPLCKHTDYTLTAQYSGDPSYLEPVNYTWFRNDKETYDLDGWVKVGTGKTYEFKDMTSAINGYYRCVVSSAGVEGEMSKCNSISDIVPIFVSEYTMEKDTVHILQGETFAGVTYDKVGVFRTSNREVNEFGCDKIVNHVVFVHPGGAEYYVTMSGRSAHTGVDWDNAIDSVEFATYLPLAKAGVVFHVAEGRYRPYFNSKYEKASKRCYYEINNDVTIIGGYSKDELDETVPNNPKKYRTIFTTSINQENNKMVESTSPRLYSMHIDNDAFIGTSRGLFIANAKAKEVKLDGIVLNYSHGFVGDHSETNLTLNRCSFEEMSDPVHYVKSLHVDTCLFRKVSIGGAPSTLFGGVATEIIIRNTTITDILGGYNDMLTCDYHGINPSLFVLENSTLVNNYANGNLVILPSSGKVRIVNNTIVNNQIGTTLSSLFSNRGSSVSVEITGNLIVGNENVSNLSHVCSNTNGNVYKYNLLDLQQELPETNMKMFGRFTSILDGWNAGNRFIPNLRDNGGYTQTVALKSDRLDDGISIIRLPLTNTTVKADQRQYTRLEKTCMGAYEIPLAECTDELGLPKEHKLTYETQTIKFTVPYRCDVRVIVTDLQGRLVRNADMLYRDRVGDVTINLSDLRLFELDHDPREPFLLTVKMGGKIHMSYLYITRLDKNY